MLKPILFAVVSTVFGAALAVTGISLVGNQSLFKRNSANEGSEITRSSGADTLSDSGTAAGQPDISFDEDDAPPSDEDIAYLIDETAGHPDDMTLPRNRLGASDEVMAALDPLTLKALLQDPDIAAFLERHSGDHRFAFAMGRMALVAGYNGRARQWLEQAARAGSGAAYAYLADPALTADNEKAATLLKQAVELGFAPARLWLAEMQDSDSVDPSAGPFDFSLFSKPDLVRAFHNNTAIEGNISELQLSSYLLSFLESVSDQSNLFLMENPREFYLELDPTLQLIASTRVATSAEVVGQATDVGLQQFMGMLQGMQNGKSLSEMVANSNRGAINPTLAIQEYRLAGEFDGKRLALMYQSYPEEFRRIYAGIRKIVKGV